jgi:ankyrin repeat protein
VKAPSESWKWLFQPLSREMRARLELCFGVVVTGAAIVGLSTVIRPEGSKLMAMKTMRSPSSFVERDSDADLRAVPPAPPRVAPEFAKAVAAGDLVTMQRLYTQGMPLDGMLAVAADTGHMQAATWLLDHGADVHEDEDTTESAVLAGDEHPELVAMLLERGVPEVSLTRAAQANAPNAVRRLLAAHAAVNDGDPSGLSAAASVARGTTENRNLIVDMLLAAGADPNHAETESALTSAVRGCEEDGAPHRGTRECLEMIDVLVKHGARTKGDAFVLALGLEERTRDAVLDALLATRLEPGATATALAQVTTVPAPVLKRLAAKGVDWSWHDGEEDAALPLLAAIQRGDRDFARALLDLGAPVDARFKDATSTLGVAIDGATNGNSADYARVVELLLARGADVNRRLPDGRTPLFAAAETGDLRILTALLDRGARVNDVVLDDTALDAAEQNGHQPAARLLHARGGRRARGQGMPHGDGD